MARKRRELEQLLFEFEETDGVVGYMGELTRAGDGWINLLPMIPENEKPTSLGLLTLFGGGSTGTTMCTWTPPRPGRSGGDRATIGLTHITGKRAIAQLNAHANALPEGWTIAQDHPRRGLVVHVPPEAPATQVLDWALRAIRVLSPDGRVPRWRADVYLPLDHGALSAG